MNQQTKLIECPVCGHEAQAEVGWELPKPGELGVCVKCAAILEWTGEELLEARAERGGKQ